MSIFSQLSCFYKFAKLFHRREISVACLNLRIETDAIKEGIL